MNYSDYRFTLDIQLHQAQVSIPVTFGDSARRLCISLNNGRKPYVIGEGCMAVFNARKPDNTKIKNYCIIENNTVIYEFTPNTTNCEGIVNCDITIYDINGKVLSSPQFIIVVDKKVVRDDAITIVSEDESTILSEIVAKELQRQSAETNRKTAETDRKTAEANRSVNEQVRFGAENARIEAENARIEAENLRCKAEDERRVDEIRREEAELYRENAEYKRVGNESNRENAEGLREWHEGLRIDAENERVEAETARADAEFSRNVAENDRNALIGDLDAALDAILESQRALLKSILPTFTLNVYGVIHTLNFETGMTWGDWITSEYNTVNITDNGGLVYYGGISVVRDSANLNVLSTTDIINANGAYIVT